MVLKNPAIDVTVPARGATNPKSRTDPAPRFIVAPATLTPAKELPKPTSAPKTVTSTTGAPGAYGIIALAPVGPVTPVGPVDPDGLN